jgi:BlaI family penicillinase repressor
MPKKASRTPTELELEILKVLWEHGPMRVREVRDALAEVRGLAYTSVMTVMNIMTRKGFLTRAKSGNSYVYRASIRRAATSKKMLGDLVDRVFEGSASAAMLHLLETSDLDDAERAQIRALIEAREQES